jgi:hypothetical protein
METRLALSCQADEQGGIEGAAAAAGLEDAVMGGSSPRIVGQDWEQNGGSVIDLETEKKRYLTQKQKRALSHKRIRDLDNSLDRTATPSSSDAAQQQLTASQGNETNEDETKDERHQPPAQAQREHEAGGNDDRGAASQPSPSPPHDALGKAPPEEGTADARPSSINDGLHDGGGGEEDGEEGKEEWEKSSTTKDSPSSPSPAAAEAQSEEDAKATAKQQQQPEEDQAAGGEKSGQKGGGLLSQLKNLMGSLGSKVREGAVAAVGQSDGDGGSDDDEDDEREDVWDELRIRTLRNTLVNKHMSHLDLNSKQVTFELLVAFARSAFSFTDALTCAFHVWIDLCVCRSR